MRRLRFRVTLRRIMVLVALLCLGFAMVRYVSRLKPSLGDRLLALVLGHETEYSAGYSEDGWNKLHVGMTTSEVEAIMGPPFYKLEYDGRLENWCYSASRRNSHRWNRMVQFRRGTIVEIEDGFYVD